MRNVNHDRIDQLRASLQKKQAEKVISEGIEWSMDQIAKNHLQLIALVDNISTEFLPLQQWKVFMEQNAWICTSHNRLDHDASDARVRKWLQSCLTDIGISGEYLISFGAYKALPWMQVIVLDQFLWLYDLWMNLEDKELLILNPQYDKVMGLFDEGEHYYYSKVKSLNSVTLFL